jgi:hypothetical protein
MPLIDGSMFMDDFVAGSEDDNGTITIYYEQVEIAPPADRTEETYYFPHHLVG